MRLLLETHVFLWYITADPKLSATFQAAIQDPANEVCLSVASVWEAVIKYSLGKLPLPAPPEEDLPRHLVGARRDENQNRRSMIGLVHSEPMKSFGGSGQRIAI